MKKLNAPLKRRRSIASKPCSKWRRRLTRSRHRDSSRAKSKRGKWTRKSSKEEFDYLLRVVHRYTLGSLSNHDDDLRLRLRRLQRRLRRRRLRRRLQRRRRRLQRRLRRRQQRLLRRRQQRLRRDDYDDDDYDEVDDGDGKNLYIVQ